MLKNIYLALLFCLTVSVTMPSVKDAFSMDIKLEPDEVLIGANFNGSNISVKGVIPRDGEAVVLLKGEPEEIRLKQKGKVFGLLWMNKGNVIIQKIPKVYLLQAAKSIDELSLSPMGVKKELGLDFKALQRSAIITSESKDAGSTDFIFKEFLKLKKSEGLYAINEDTVAYTALSQQTKSFASKIRIPSRFKKGEYIIEVLTVKDGVVEVRSSKPLIVKEVGLPAFISKMAHQQSAIYGILAALIAILAGLLMGILFSKR